MKGVDIYGFDYLHSIYYAVLELDQNGQGKNKTNRTEQ